MADLMVTQTYSLTAEHVKWLRERGERDSRRGASGVLRAILDAVMAEEQRQKDSEEAA